MAVEEEREEREEMLCVFVYWGGEREREKRLTV